jgi:hypothetical protein
MNLGYVQREWSMHWPAMRADVSKFSAFRRASLVKEDGVRVEKANIVEPQPSVE